MFFLQFFECDIYLSECVFLVDVYFLLVGQVEHGYEG